MNKIAMLFNPAAGKKDSISASTLREMGFEGEIMLTESPGDVLQKAKRLAGTVDTLAVYGGDGTVMEAARVLFQSDTALAIIPGGTANVMAKELRIPQDTQKALNLLKGGNRVKHIEMGIVNGCPFLIRVNLGIFADMITEVNAELKEKWGQLAYGLAAFQTGGREGIEFHLTIDGNSFLEKAVALTVTNAGNVGKPGYSFLPNISVDDGWLDVIALDHADLMSLMRVTGSILLQKESGVLRHWKAQEIKICFDSANRWLCDDAEGTGNELQIKVAKSALKVLVPLEEAI